jgi:hypothetical protein
MDEDASLTYTRLCGTRQNLSFRKFGLGTENAADALC